MAERVVRQPFASAARSAGVNQVSNSVSADGFTTASVLVDLTSVSGAPDGVALDVWIMYSPDLNGGRWFELPGGRFNTVNGAGHSRIDHIDIGTARRLWVMYTLAFDGGTSPQAVFSVDIATQQVTPNTVSITSSAESPVVTSEIHSRGSNTVEFSQSDSSQELVSANASAKERLILNDSEEAIMIKFDNPATTSSFALRINPNDMLRTLHQGSIHGVWTTTGQGVVRVTEML